MNNFLACAGINGNENSVKKLVEAANARRPDAILVAGGITRPDSSQSQKRDFLVKCFEALGKSGHVVVLIPGPHDAPLAEFLRAVMNAEIVFPNLFSAHATMFSKGNIAVNGIGGLITDSEDSTAPTIKYSHTSAEYLFRSLWHSRKSIKILMLSEPPAGKLSGNGGNSLVGEFIKTYHPAICITEGKKKYRGFEKEKHGFVINPGSLSEGSAAWVNWLGRSVEILDL